MRKAGPGLACIKNQQTAISSHVASLSRVETHVDFFETRQERTESSIAYLSIGYFGTYKYTEDLLPGL